MQAPRVPFSVGLAAVFALGVAFYVWKKGGIGGAASAAGAGVVDAGVAFVGGAATAAGTAASGAVGAIGATVGLPTPMQTTTDPRVARWIIDNAGYWQASLWSGVPALWAASSLPAGSGTAPPPGSPIADAFPNAATYDETARLLDRYPAPAPASNAPTFDASTINWMMGS